VRAERVRLGLVALHSQGERLTIRSVGDRVHGVRCLNTIFQGNQFVSCLTDMKMNERKRANEGKEASNVCSFERRVRLR